MSFKHAHRDFPVLERYTYLNTGTFGPLLQRSLDVLGEAAQAETLVTLREALETHRRIRIVDVEPFQHGPDGVRLGRLPQGQRAYEALLVQGESLSLGEGVAILGRRHPPALNCSICAINRLLSAFAAAYLRPT